MNPVEEMRELERLWQESRYSTEFNLRQRVSKWGERIREEVIAGIRSGSSKAIEDGILYLETNPWYHRSGYHKGRVACSLKSAGLTLSQKERLRCVILKAVDSGVGREFREYARLAIVVANAEFVEEVKHRLNFERGLSRSRLKWLSSLCGKHIAATNKPYFSDR